MSSTLPRERLSRLVELAAETDLAARRALVDGLADLLLDWPAAYPTAMREPFEALLEKSLRDVEPGLRAALADRFIERADAPLHFLNLLVFDAATDTKSAILMRNAHALGTPPAMVPVPGQQVTLLAAARACSGDMLPGIIASRFGIAPEIATQVLADESGWMLAALCKGAKLARATFSALAILAHPKASTDQSYRRLSTYDGIPQEGAAALLAFWRKHIVQPQIAAEAA
jgi:hypothetical protein